MTHPFPCSCYHFLLVNLLLISVFIYVMLGDIVNDMAFLSIGDVNLVLTFVIVNIQT